jgi:4-aminobutyrate aminotransferase-like enzyme
MRPDELRQAFLRHVCQTSPAPLGIVVARAEGATIWDVDGREYLDLLSGIGVANVGHGHPDVIAAVQAQAARYLHVMVYGEAVESRRCVWRNVWPRSRPRGCPSRTSATAAPRPSRAR